VPTTQPAPLETITGLAEPARLAVDRRGISKSSNARGTVYVATSNGSIAVYAKDAAIPSNTLSGPAIQTANGVALCRSTDPQRTHPQCLSKLPVSSGTSSINLALAGPNDRHLLMVPHDTGVIDKCAYPSGTLETTIFLPGQPSLKG
jgi:hypothetical protein